MSKKANYVFDELMKLFPDAKCELIHSNPFELICAVALSAQTTDERVNMVTPNLFKTYADAKSLKDAKLSDLEKIISSLGLYHNKALNLIAMAKDLDERFNGVVPNNREDLESLKGVGRKTANVVLSVAFDIPALAVDTHVSRVAKRLAFAKYDDDVLEIEKKLCKTFPKYKYNKLHHLLIFFGRYKCKAKNPICDNCPFIKICKRNKYEK